MGSLPQAKCIWKKTQKQKQNLCRDQKTNLQWDGPFILLRDRWFAVLVSVPVSGLKIGLSAHVWYVPKRSENTDEHMLGCLLANGLQGSLSYGNLKAGGERAGKCGQITEHLGWSLSIRGLVHNGEQRTLDGGLENPSCHLDHSTEWVALDVFLGLNGLLRPHPFIPSLTDWGL